MHHTPFYRYICGLLFVGLIGSVLAGILTVRPTHAEVQATCEEGVQESGALYRICMPTSWNGTLTLYAHGYVSPTIPIALPVTTVGTVSIEEILTAQDYAFATTSYSRNGLAVQEGIADLVDLVRIFHNSKGTPTKILVIGVSEGALISTLVIERYPQLFDAGLSLCGPYGDFRRQIEYMGDFRVLFDYFFPDLMPPTPIDIPADLLTSWESDTYSNTIKPQLTEPANAEKVNQLLAVSSAAFDVNDSSSKEKTVADLLWYNVFSTNDAKARLSGQPFDNRNRDYTGSANDSTLNQDVQRFDADQAALTAIEVSYQTSGYLRVPLITAHTTLDPIVPVGQQDLYRAKVEAMGSKALYEQYQSDRYGHCNFTLLELQAMFTRLNVLADSAQNEFVYLPLVSR